MPTGNETVSRRRLLRAVGAGASLTAIGAVGAQPDGETDDAATGQDQGGFFGTVGNYDGTVVDARGEDSVTVTVGAEGNDGPNAFAPPAIQVDEGATVQWEWTGRGAHNVVSTGDGPLDSGAPTADAGVNYEYTFEEDGIYPYVCVPHEALGMKGAVVVGDADVETDDDPAPDPYYDGWFTDVSNYDGTTVDARDADRVTVDVGAEGNAGNFAFDPPAVRVSTGTTVAFEWIDRGGRHDVVSDDDGPLDSGSPVEATGVQYEHTFQNPGVYRYVCTPHVGLGMKGVIVVDEAFAIANETVVSDDDRTSDRSPDDGLSVALGPGMGLGSALAGLGGAGYLLGRRRREETDDP